MSQSIESVGLIGVGLLGSAMAQRLMEKGLIVRGYDLDSNRMTLLSEAGGIASDSINDVLLQEKVILLSLPTSNDVTDVVQSVQTLVRPPHLFVDTTTGDPQEMATTAERIAAAGGRYLEATVAGSSEQAARGHATLFLGGDRGDCDRVRPILDRLSTNCFYLGNVGAASRFKLVHNLVLGLNRAVLAEGLAFAESLGFDPALTLEVLRSTPAASGVMTTKGQKMVDRDYRPQARLAQHLKDVRLILDLAREQQAPTPLSEIHRELLERAEELGFGDSDNSAVIEAYRK